MCIRDRLHTLLLIITLNFLITVYTYLNSRLALSSVTDYHQIGNMSCDDETYFRSDDELSGLKTVIENFSIVVCSNSVISVCDYKH